MVLHNREEFFDRPTQDPRINSESKFPNICWLGGIDLKAGGTWLGVNQHGLIVAIINRQKKVVPVEPPSRGHLCRELLNQSSIKASINRAEELLASNRYAGCNVAILSKEKVVIIEAANQLTTSHLEPGIIVFSNGSLQDQTDRRIFRVKSKLESFERKNMTIVEQVTSIQKLSGLHADRENAAICLHEEDRGTVSSTIIALTTVPGKSEYHYSAGPPCETIFDDYSEQLQQLLSTQ